MTDDDRPPCEYERCDADAVEAYDLERWGGGTMQFWVCDEHAPDEHPPARRVDPRRDVATDGGTDELVEALAALEHKQWCEWSRNLADSEPIGKPRLDRWEDYWVPYDELDDEVKEHDRMWARKVLATVDEHVDAADFDVDAPELAGGRDA